MHRHSFLKKLVNTGLVVHFLQGKTIKKEAAPYGASFCLAVPPKLTCVLLYSLYRASPSDSSSTAPERNKYVLLLPRTTRQLSEKHQHTASLSQRFLII